MVSSPDRRGARPLFHLPKTRATRPLESAGGNATTRLPETPIPPLSPIKTTRPLSPSTMVTKPLGVPDGITKHYLVIHASQKRPQTVQLPHSHRRHLLVLTGLVLCLVGILVTALFVAPLDNGEHAQNIVQAVRSWFSNGRPMAISAAQQIDPPTATPALSTGEGYCGGTDIWGTCATAITASGVMGTGQMQRPIAGAVITQPFAHLEYQWWCGCWKPHNGIDLAATYGTQVTATDSGQVIWTGWDWSGLGWAVKINHGHYIATIYGHLERFIVSVGQNVTKGQVIGYEGSTGASTGPHVHFMVLVNNVWVNPVLYVQLP